ncbi:MAG: acyltransferase [Leptolyngbyaceae cyanobacterium SM1_1_3]|nr:acyltransferase [Leptolyngbyaceae cyanobacterium SM1_1_3]NJO10516.1 acyltransferase [Leptolyngbyaceae cyanobacterium SL_1_1]
MVIAKVSEHRTDSPNNLKNTQNLLYLDIFRCLAIIGVVGVHLLADLEISPVKFYPSGEGIVSNLSALFTYTVSGNSLKGIGLQLFQLCLKFGWQAVHIFIFISGFGLYLSYLRASDNLTYKSANELGLRFWLKWLKRRMNRVLPKYWVMLTVIFVVKTGIAVLDALADREAFSRPVVLFIQYLMSLSLIRGFSQASFFALAGAFWYIPLIVGLYLAFPILVYFLCNRRLSMPILLLGTVLLSLNYRFIVNIDPCATPIPFQIHESCQNPWDWNLHKLISIHVPYGIFLARLPEFVLGMWLARLQVQGTLKQIFGCWQTRLKVLTAGIAVWGLGNITSYYKASWPLCDCLIGFGLVAILLAVFYGSEHSPVRYLSAGIKALSEVSYEIYLVHQLVFFLLSRFLAVEALGYAPFCLVYLGLALAAACWLNYACRGLTIDRVPLVNGLYRLVEHQVVRQFKYSTSSGQSVMASKV